jgi:uncharacterized protein YndB with AHSA1/START domain
MEASKTLTPVTIETTVNATPEKAWKIWNTPEDITQWCSADLATWHTPWAQNDLRKGGIYKCRMEARDGSAGFVIESVYDEVVPHKHIQYTMSDGRKVVVDFIPEGNNTKIVQRFDPENENPVEFQRAGWQAILDNYKKYVESK